ncbi:2-phospho-L-lactate guanylyltransferase [Cellulomonas sp. NPDC089187]|uniref:2-phospho-L-lactate guanylyltransferase n=1 Tax=Cellulomonas sp. NPDC089187 TaxID=3154970 RepID=UPI00343571CB
MRSARWVVVVPVKDARRGKTRLAEVLEPGARAALVRAMAWDTVAGVADCPAVARTLVVTGDPEVSAAVRELPRVGVLPEPDAQVGSGWAALDRAVLAGVQRARTEAPGVGVAVLLGDLPRLDPGELGAALSAAAAQVRSVLADAEGTGTTLLTVGPGVDFRSRFGPGSAAAHQGLGYRRLALEVPTLREDVDLPADLTRLLDRGVDGRTGALLRRLAPLPIPSSEREGTA